MRTSFKSGAAATLLSCISLSAFADDTVNLGPVMVTATRTPLIADQEVAPVIVIGPEQLQLAAGGNVGDVLRQYAGLDVATSGGPGQPASLFLRGANSNQTLVMINGVRINPTTLGGAPLENIRLEDIERIEIVKGPRASLYGSDAIGGVINIITRPAAPGLQYGAYAGGGRYGTYDNGGHVNYGEGDSAITVSGDDYHTDGFPAVAGRTDNDGTINRTVNASGQTKLGGLDLSFNHWQSNGYTQYLGADFSTFAPEQVAEDFRDQATGLGLSGNFLGGWRSKLSLSHMLDDVDQRQVDPFNATPSPDFLHSQRNIIDWQNDFSLTDRQLLTAGLYSEEQHASAQSFGQPYDPTDRVDALYAEDDLDFTDQRLVLALRDTHDQAFGNHGTWNLDYGYDWDANTKLTAGAGTGFRAPSAADRFGFDGNPDLQPETSQNLELGLRHKLGDSQQFVVSVFQQKLDDLIVFQPMPTAINPFAGLNENVGHARVQGIELGYQLNGDSWSWRTDASLQNPENLDNDTVLLRRSRRSLTTNLLWHDEFTSAGVNLLLSGPRSDVDNSGNPATDGGYLLAGVSLHRELGEGFAVLARIDNLLDARYQTASGYNTAGRSLFISLEYESR
jgi:vitamin B12 transporter